MNIYNKAAIQRTGSLFAIILCIPTSMATRCLAIAQGEKAKWQQVVVKENISPEWETKGNWQVLKSGELRLAPRAGEAGWRRFDAYLWSKGKYRSFEIDFEYKFQPEGNSGFFFCVGDKANPVENGIEVQLMDPQGATDATPLNDHDAGGFIPSIPPTSRAAKPAGELNHMQVVVDHDKVAVTLNGKKVNEIKLPHASIKNRPLEGFIGFQDHGLPLALRNVRIRVLD